MREDIINGYVEHLRTASTYRPWLLGAATLIYGDVTEDDYSWSPPSKVALQRMLTRPRDEYPCTEKDLEDTISQAVAMALLDESSTPGHLVLGGYGHGGGER